MVVLPFLVFAFFFALLSPSEGLVVEGLLVQREDGCSCLSFCAFCETHFRFFGWRRPAGAAAFFSKIMSPTSQLFFTGLPAVFFFFFFFVLFFSQRQSQQSCFCGLVPVHHHHHHHHHHRSYFFPLPSSDLTRSLRRYRLYASAE